MTIKSRYKVVTGRFEDYHGNVTTVYKEVDFDDLCQIKGIKCLGRSASQERAARSRLISTHIFNGGRATQWEGNKKIEKIEPLEALAASNNIAAYVTAWRAINHLTQ